MGITVQAYRAEDLPRMIALWNAVVLDGIAFPQVDTLNLDEGRAFFGAQTYCGVAWVDDAAQGMYILHPNNVGRCGHIANASYAVARNACGQHIGETLVLDSLTQARRFGFTIMQFNAVVATNLHARHLYERLGFVPLGTIPAGFRLPDGSFADICPYYLTL